MLTMLLRKVKGINRTIKIIDAQLVWTEPHSKRIRMKLTVNQEIMTNTTMQKTVFITFKETNQQCNECMKSFTPHTWNAVVQLRQKVGHKRTFMFLEQLILKHNAHKNCLNVEEKGKEVQY